jgi:cytochrome c oxidase assembly protein subunit 15
VLAHRIACLTAAATLALILAGGLVTDTGSALAVPDWPTTFGYNLLLYPWSKMVGGVLYEHSHRLLGALVGALTVGLALALWRGERRWWVRVLGVAAVLLVTVQGVLGGLRVLLRAETIAIVHGCLAPAFFALTVVLARVTGAGWAATPPPAPGGQLRALAVAACLVLYVQIVLGALLTHGGSLGLHLAGAAAVFAFVPIVTARARATGQPALARPARALLGLLLVQLLLGPGAFLARFSGLALPGGRVTGLALPVAHRLVAALILAEVAALLTVLVRAEGAAADPARRGTRLETVALRSAP